MPKRYVFIPGMWILVLVLWALPALADIVADTVWVRRYDGPGNVDDVSTAIALDSSNNVYVTGGSENAFVTVKYYSTGDTAWTRRFGGLGSGGARAMTIDGLGNIHVAGRGGTDYVTVKYYTDGDTAWARRYNGPLNLWEWPSAIATDASNSIYVTGWSDGSTSYDYATVKYDAFGNELWSMRYSGPWADWAIATAVDGSGNVYVTGYSSGTETGWDCATVKYDSSGNEIWVRRYNGPGNGHDYAYDITVDSNDNVYLAGESFGRGSWGDFTIIKYYPNGDTGWVRSYNGPVNGYDRALAIAIDGSGNICATGYSGWTPTEMDYLTAKYDSSGNLLWVKRYKGPESSNDVAFAISTDVSDNVYVTGTSCLDPHQDYATIRYTPLGDVVWVIRCDGMADWGRGAPSLAVDDSANVYVSGANYDSVTGYDYVTFRYVQALRGDVDRNGVIDPADVVHLISYLFRDGNPPDPLAVGDCNCDEVVEAGDVVFLINYLFRNGPPPSC